MAEEKRPAEEEKVNEDGSEKPQYEGYYDRNECKPESAHRWQPTGRTRPAVHFADNKKPDREFVCAKCGKIAWNVETAE